MTFSMVPPFLACMMTGVPQPCTAVSRRNLFGSAEEVGKINQRTVAAGHVRVQAVRDSRPYGTHVSFNVEHFLHNAVFLNDDSEAWCVACLVYSLLGSLSSCEQSPRVRSRICYIETAVSLAILVAGQHDLRSWPTDHLQQPVVIGRRTEGPKSRKSTCFNGLR